ncbi:exodeoxyribonuclease III [Litchfieldella xinjiangensis]|uniref:exodeoxyribonuclease III n=1 Tax=Litchfieldella xinjiangensis TaxID=1166948 RepID=UPI0005BCDD94|nr:exodeoxyribonuclease III [Halomonas xinjiangensis]
MRLVSFNINGVRARLHQLEALIEAHHPAVIGLQETKVQDSEFPEAAIRELGYHVYYHGQKGHYGVALLCRDTPEEVYYGLPDDGEEAQRRMIGARLKSPNGSVLTVWNGYFPQGENIEHPTKFPNKRAFYASVSAMLEKRHRPEEAVAIMGDFNISPEDIDIGIGEASRKRWLREGKTSFQPIEREWLGRLKAWGLEDSYRRCHPHVDDRFSWFDYRSRGFERDPRRGLRIDYILVTPSLGERVAAADIDYGIRSMERPSDHAPVWVELKA